MQMSLTACRPTYLANRERSVSRSSDREKTSGKAGCKLGSGANSKKVPRPNRAKITPSPDGKLGYMIPMPIALSGALYPFLQALYAPFWNILSTS
ncbi:uncharacterized protein BO72DRAFT_212993 [Aspergillus fijiensis CBS 313.89]|uniref:Uncharacterized protein n=1 Tax=Aspergillus fijiensis CBS 313.89 TaxID=1448319 RepID=A0A8G1VWF1_9EURO|nr:uncharacterized protein BO72DRAFT_212993 [Aspergillus fijiensis CBS 313.89]RAK74193.1 hypothetical protein BO72DRAFT_212993 [Aspergillus fijiensis CBS 313.89]